MKVAYLARVELSRTTGVLKKITRQIINWQKLGLEVELFVLSKSEHLSSSNLENINYHCWESKNYPQLFISSAQAVGSIQKWQPDLIYCRYSTGYPGLHNLMRRYKTILELNSNHTKEYKVINKLAYAIHELTFRRIFKQVAGFSVLTVELEQWVSGFGRPTLILGDGFDFERIPIHPAPVNRKPRLVCLASTNFPWVGLDKILEMAEHFPSWDFDIIGQESKDTGLGELPDNVSCLGFLYDEQYSKILAGADIAIGTLALHRIGLTQMAPLKLREYLAYGLPSIIAYEDTDFSDETPFILRLPNTETNVVQNLNRIESFVTSWRGRRVPRHSIEHLSMWVKETERVEFMKKVAGF